MLKKSLKFSTMLLGIALFMFACNKNNDPAPGSGSLSTAVFNSNVTYGTMTDQDGNEYKTVTIGAQTWMAENLRAVTYNDGTPITHAPGNAAWAALTEGGYCVLDNKTDDIFIATYGNLYNWHALNSGKLAPTGWHVPTNAEWNTLMNTLGGETVAGEKLKEAGTTHWVDYFSSIPGTNESGFTGLPGSDRAISGTFAASLGVFGQYWTATADPGFTGYSFSWNLSHGTKIAERQSEKQEKGFSVRLIKD